MAGGWAAGVSGLSEPGDNGGGWRGGVSAGGGSGTCSFIFPANESNGTWELGTARRKDAVQFEGCFGDTYAEDYEPKIDGDVDI